MAAAPDPLALSAAQVDEPFAVGTTRIEVPARDGRMLPVQLWYPASEASASSTPTPTLATTPIYRVEPEGPARDELEGLLSGGDPACTNLDMHAEFEAQPSTELSRLPVVVVSHHFAGTRVSTFSINETLASHGFLVAAPDHVGITLRELHDADLLTQLDANSAEKLEQRAGDVSSVLDAVLAPGQPLLPQSLRGWPDPERVGIYGHSMGTLTVATASVADTRVKAVAFLAMIPTSPLLSLVVGTPSIEALRVPALYLAPLEDHVIDQAGGMAALRDAYQRQTPPAWLVEVSDLGHFAVADDLAANPAFVEGCGEGTRVAWPYASYENLPSSLAREIAARYVSAFFDQQLRDEAGSPLLAADPADSVTVHSHD